MTGEPGEIRRARRYAAAVLDVWRPRRFGMRRQARDARAVRTTSRYVGLSGAARQRPGQSPHRDAALRRLPQLGQRTAYLKQEMEDLLIHHRAYIQEQGIDMPEVLNWKWE